MVLGYREAVKYFYVFRLIAYPGLIITVVELITFWSSPSHQLIALLILKVVTSMLLVLYVFLFKREEILFFHNLGITSLRFYGAMLFMDTTFFVFAVSIMLTFK
jgi:hypothetical protein